MAKLTVQIDSVATLREAGKSSLPEPSAVAVLAEIGGADGIAVHLREDRQDIQDRDLRILRQIVHTKLELKVTATSEMLGIALNIKPDSVILVPEMGEDNSFESGYDLMVHKTNVSEMINNLENSGIPVGIFIEPDPEQLKLAHQCNANTVEINTGPYCAAVTSAKRTHLFARIVDVVKLARRLKMGVNVGRGIGYDTISTFNNLPEIDTFTIGHSIISRAVMTGMEKAVRDMVRLIQAL
jgi:pyridoxine 5-phosphate synthase